MPTALTPLRLLQVAPAFAASPTSGAELRSYHLAATLARHMVVVHLGFSPYDNRDCSAHNTNQLQFQSVPRSHKYRLVDLLRGMFGSVPFSVLNYTRANMKTELRRNLEANPFDIVQIESIHLAGYLPMLQCAPSKPAIVCDWHNIESELLSRYGECTSGITRKLYGIQGRKLERYERWFVNQCDMHLVVSDRDRHTLMRYGTGVPIVVIDNGVQVEHFRIEEAGQSPRRGIPRKRVLFVGSMDYRPNVGAVTEFAVNVWPGIHQCLPDVVFTVVGRNPSAEVLALGDRPGIEVTGSVPDVRPYYREAFVAVVPLSVGGGTRLKILEAMASGVPVVSSTLGAEGLSAVPDQHYFLANTAREMRDKVIEVARGGGRVRCVASAGLELVRHRYDWSVLADTLIARLTELTEMRRHGTHGR